MEKEKECSSCKKGLSNTHWTMILVSVYILFAAVYGTIQLVKGLINLF